MINPTKKELLISHLFDAPKAVVFQAWTDPDKLKRWYAPDGCTIEFKSIEVIKGGRFHSCIHDPVHGECWITGEYLEVSPPDKLVFTMVLADRDGNSVTAAKAGKSEEWPEAIITTVTFEAIGEQTKVTIHQTVDKEEAKKTGAFQSWIKMLNKLHRLLEV